jgi:hypothetical protein
VGSRDHAALAEPGIEQGGPELQGALALHAAAVAAFFEEMEGGGHAGSQKAKKSQAKKSQTLSQKIRL